MRRLDGERVVLTGASSGIGRAAAERFAREGADPALVARGRSGLEVAARAARRHGAVAHVVPADIADAGAIERAVSRAEAQLEGVDVVVANAGAGAYGRFTETSREDFERTEDAGLGGRPSMTREVARLVRVTCATARTPGTAARMLGGFCELTIETRDVAGLERFYTTAFGLQVLAREDDRVWLAVGRRAAARGPAAPRARARPSRPRPERSPPTGARTRPDDDRLRAHGASAR